VREVDAERQIEAGQRQAGKQRQAEADRGRAEASRGKQRQTEVRGTVDMARRGWEIGTRTAWQNDLEARIMPDETRAV
jgi:hypothetical protein